MESDESRPVVDCYVEECDVAVAHQNLGIILDRVVVEQWEKPRSTVSSHRAKDSVYAWLLEQRHYFLSPVLVRRCHEPGLQHLSCRVSEAYLVALFCEKVYSGFERERVRVT